MQIRAYAAPSFLLAVASVIANGAVLAADAASGQEVVHAVYHIDAGKEQANTALHNIGNQLDADPTAKIVVVAIGNGVDFLLKDSETAGGYPFDLMIQELQTRGVRFEACGNTLATRKLDRTRLDDGIVVVPSGMAELARLQVREHYAYLKP
jgi:intracellular sulfur oxidation DsrE/DsrF family protein